MPMRGALSPFYCHHRSHEICHIQIPADHVLF